MTQIISSTAQVDNFYKRDGVTPWHFFEPKYISSWQAVNSGSNYFFAHGLGRQPYLVRCYVKYRTSTNDPLSNLPAFLAGDLGVWGTGASSDYGGVLGVSNSLICVGAGEQGWSTDWGASQNGFPIDVSAFENFFYSKGQNNAGDFMDTPTETAGTLGDTWVMVMAW